jgi:hypothetical protein
MLFSKSSLPKMPPSDWKKNLGGRPKWSKWKPYIPVLAWPVDIEEIKNPWWNKKRKPIKKISEKKRGNTKREITKKTADEVIARDKLCIIPKCGMLINEIHHAFYGIDADYSPDRNKASNLVWLCKWCHDKLHSRGGNDYRKFCKEYLKWKYPTQ